MRERERKRKRKALRKKVYTDSNTRQITSAVCLRDYVMSEKF